MFLLSLICGKKRSSFYQKEKLSGIFDSIIILINIFLILKASTIINLSYNSFLLHRFLILFALIIS